MHSKKGVIISTLIGVVIVALIITFVLVPLFQGILSIIIPRPDYSSVQGFERVWTAMQNSPEGKSAYVPFDLKAGYKITTNNFDSICKNKCICLCADDALVKSSSGLNAPQKGCKLKIYGEHCSSKNINLHGEISLFAAKIAAANQVGVLTINKGAGQIDLSGNFVGRCNFKTYSECAKAGDCFAKFGVEKGTFSINLGNYLGCIPCSDSLTDESGKLKTVGCERYSYKELTDIGTNGISATSSYSYDFKVPLDHPNIKDSKSQCETDDPCKLKAKGTTCKWEEDTTAKTGTCKTATATSP